MISEEFLKKVKKAQALANKGGSHKNVEAIICSPEFILQAAKIILEVPKLIEALEHYSDKHQFEDRGTGVTSEEIACEALTEFNEEIK